MKNNTSAVNGGALPKINRATVMHRAWAIFREGICSAGRLPIARQSLRPALAAAIRLDIAKGGPRRKVT